MREETVAATKSAAAKLEQIKLAEGVRVGHVEAERQVHWRWWLDSSRASEIAVFNDNIIIFSINLYILVNFNYLLFNKSLLS